MVTDNVVYSSGENRAMEKSRSWPSAHDWKSCIPQKGIEGSNPSFSAIKRNHPVGWFLFMPKEGFEDVKCNSSVNCCRRGLDRGEPYIFAKGKNE